VEVKVEAVAGRLPFVDCTLHVEGRTIELEAAGSFGIDGRDKNHMNRPFDQLVRTVLGGILMAVCNVRVPATYNRHLHQF
jgi:hypothetical protein